MCHLRWVNLPHTKLLRRVLKRLQSDWWKRVISDFEDHEVSMVLGDNSHQFWFWAFDSSPVLSEMPTALKNLSLVGDDHSFGLEVIPNSSMDFETWGRLIEHQKHVSWSYSSSVPVPFNSFSGEVDSFLRSFSKIGKLKKVPFDGTVTLCRRHE